MIGTLSESAAQFPGRDPAERALARAMGVPCDGVRAPLARAQMRSAVKETGGLSAKKWARPCPVVRGKTEALFRWEILFF